MFKSNTEYTNRYGDKYHWESINNVTYKFCMEGTSIDYCRTGFNDDMVTVFFDPSGGPFVEIGNKIDGKPIYSIQDTEEGFIVEVE